MSNVLASEANVATRHELFSTCCLRTDGKCRDTTRHALKKWALTRTDPSQKEAYSRQKKIKSGPGRVLGLAYVCMSLEGRHRSGACRVDCHRFGANISTCRDMLLRFQASGGNVAKSLRHLRFYPGRHECRVDCRDIRAQGKTSRACGRRQLRGA